MKSLHTATPWTYGIRAGISDTHCIYGVQGRVHIAEMVDRRTTEEISADAAHIVMCVNSHDDLVSALRALVVRLEYINAEVGADYYNAVALLAKVQSC